MLCLVLGHRPTYPGSWIDYDPTEMQDALADQPQYRDGKCVRCGTECRQERDAELGARLTWTGPEGRVNVTRWGT
jgi:hypothetical protein